MLYTKNCTRLSLLAVWLLLLTGVAHGQVKAPYELQIDGVKVIVQPSGNEIVQIQTFFKGGVQNYSDDQQGIESLAITALTECGTTKDDKNSFKNKLDVVDAQMGGFAGIDYSSFTMNCIKSDFSVVWPLYVDALTHPLFDSKEFDRIKQNAINQLKSRSSQPDYAIRKMARETAFKGTSHARMPEGNETTVSNLTVDQTKAYYQGLLTRSKLLIVVVGEVDRGFLESSIGSLLAQIPEGQPYSAASETYAPKHNTFSEEKRDLATNYIQGVTGAPLPGSADFNAFALAMAIFYDRHFLEVRTNNGLSYAPSTYFDEGLFPSSNIAVSTKEPDKYIAVLNALIAKTKSGGFTEDELRNVKTYYLTSFYYQQETNSAQSSSLGKNALLHNNWRRSLTLTKDIQKVTVSDLNRVFNKYITSLTWVYQGDTTKVDPALYLKGADQGPKVPSSSVSKPKND